MILLLGGSGYIGGALARELGQRDWDFAAPRRTELDYTRFDVLNRYLRKEKPEFVINAAGVSGKPNVDECEIARAETLQGNTLFPQMLALTCAQAGIPLGHVSSGCIYSGAKVLENGQWRIEKNLTQTHLRHLFDTQPTRFAGFTEEDEPNFTFRSPPCSFYSGTKALAEESIAGVGKTYLWRLRLPVEESDNPRNYLSKIQRYSKVYDNVNSLSHLGDMARAALDLWERRSPFGIYNMTNPGAVTTRQIVELIRSIRKIGKPFEYFDSDAQFYQFVKAPRSNCILDASKLLRTGVRMRPVHEALVDALERWSADVHQPLQAAMKLPRQPRVGLPAR